LVSFFAIHLALTLVIFVFFFGAEEHHFTVKTDFLRQLRHSVMLHDVHVVQINLVKGLSAAWTWTWLILECAVVRFECFLAGEFLK